MMALAFILIAVISYLLGSLNFGVIISHKLKNDDVRNHGSGNAGSTNMLRNYGKGIAALTIIGDMLKVVVAILVSFAIISYVPNTLELIEGRPDFDKDMFIKSYSGFFCVLGHIFPCFFKFKGGKGVATSGGMVFVVDWRIALILLAVFIIVVLISKYVSLGSIVMALLYPVFIFVFHKSLLLTGIAVIFTIIVVTAHRENIKKLINHTESKITDKKQK
ncbi:MAG: glycerol-3-phosphate 1-O-acyltransferase PlsY [Acetobacter sp.]|nr:glycerol-3-phosphate 1-O-acyltransferase PlsY [Bacteroides sp.]MCM1340544.1 glycerol-3-phosphate 1-O-acyltransferase PlsY [Acetobacter sp.]MCM1433284.1 glycerol-3-phosphate 1-O-acyltransferase PlsY [Clostridiales bacterium]